MRGFFHTNPYTKWSSILIFIILLAKLISNESWKNPNAVISADVKGYYGYLPALFIHHDLQFTNEADYVYKDDTKIWFNRTDDGKKYIKFPPGMAIMYSPFYAMAHASTSFIDAPANGYSYPYQIGLLIGSLFYTVVGLFFICKLLLRHFDDRASASTILVIYLATNLFYYTTYDFTLTHGYSFALISAFLFGFVRWLDTFEWRYVFLLGLSGGLMVAVRNIDAIFLSFVFLYGVRSFADFKGRCSLFIAKRWQALIGVFCIFLMLSPQILYNYYVSGTFWMDAYSDEKFFFTAPHLFDSLLSYRNGWLLYTPVMILSVIGILFLKKRVPSMFVFTLFALPIYYYLLASWWCWWFSGLGNRAYINLYPILAFSLAALFSYLYEQKRYKLYLTNIFILFAIQLNWFQSYQLATGVIHWDGMNRDLYWHVFGREERSQSQSLMVETPVLEDALQGIQTVYASHIDTLSSQYFSFENKLDAGKSHYRKFTYSHSGGYSLMVPGALEESVAQSFTLPKGTTHISIKAWVKGRAESFIVVRAEEPKPFYYFSNEVIERDGDWRRIEILATPFQDVNYKKMEFLLWNKGSKLSYLDDITVRCLAVSQKKKFL